MTITDDDGVTSEVFFEFTAIGRTVKVTAIESASGVEVSVIGPATAARTDLARLALQKLQSRLKASPEP